VKDLPQQSDCTAIIEAVAGLARKLDMRSVAEGIETSQQLAIVTGIGCDSVQGYYFNRPLPGADVGKLLSAQ
jgi:diguanylate cyclase